MISSSRSTNVVRGALRNSKSTTSRRTASTLTSRGKISARGARALTATRKHLVPVPAIVQYSTEQVLKLRGSKLDPEKTKVLYDANNEQDSCGVGLIANLKSKPSRHVVDTADEMLVRMAHRGGCGCDPNSGDGAGTFFISFFYCAARFSSYSQNLNCLWF